MKLIGWIIAIVAVINMLTAVVKSCEDCVSGKTQEDLQQALAGVELEMDELTYSYADDGSVVNCVRLKFKNTGGERVHTFACDALLYDEQDEYIGKVYFDIEMNVVGIVGIDAMVVEPGDYSIWFTKELISAEGRIAKSVKIENLKVNGDEKWYDSTFGQQ